MSRANEVIRAQRAFRQGGDTRMLKRELAAGNRYAIAKLTRLGLVYSDGSITRRVSA